MGARDLFLSAIIYLSAFQILVDSSQDLMKSLTISFTKPLNECKKDLNLPDNIDEEFYKFWREDHEVTNYFTGCAISCLAFKLDLVDGNGVLIHGNNHEFIKNHGADDAKAQQLVDILHMCQAKVDGGKVDDLCIRVLDIANCFKMEIHKLDWAPTMDLIIGEVLAEVH